MLTGNYRDSGEKIQVTYRWETNEYSWPFVIEGIGNTVAVRPSNVNKDNSYAILYADVYLEAGDALIFDYLSSTQNNSNGVDYLVTIFDGKDITNYTNKEMRDIRTKMQIIFQDPYSSLPPRSTVGGMLSEPVPVHQSVPTSQVKA